MEIYTIIGILGMLLILIAFILNEIGRLEAENKKYDLINLIGSLMLVYYAWALWSIPFLILNIVWAIVSLRELLQ